MKGLVFNLLEVAVSRDHGADAWDDLVGAARVRGGYVSQGDYDEAEFEALVGCAAKVWDLSREDVLRWFGRRAIPVLAELYPDFFAPHDSARAFIGGMNAVVHAELRKRVPGAACPQLGVREGADGRLTVGYRSENRLCALAHGFIEGSAAYWCEAVEIEHPACVACGDESCEFEIRWIARA